MICLLVIIFTASACPSVPKRGEYPSDNNFLEGDKSFYEGEYEAAITRYQAYLDNNSGSAFAGEAWMRMGLSRLALGDYDKALYDLLKAENKTKRTFLKAQVFGAIGRCYLFKREYEHAARYFKKVLSTGEGALPEDEVFFNLATALMRSGRWDDGINYFKRLIKEHPESRYAEAAKERLYFPPNNFVVQISKYQDKENAEEEMKELSEGKEIKTSLKIMLIEGEQYYFIWAGSFSSWEEAFKKAEEVQAKGVEAIVVP
ncbi:MAG: tetratricopeptide repeat protein [Planctomycetes bacterium]|nr:tetratricopeptide repeat protein [Planctomycetota bacterium]